MDPALTTAEVIVVEVHCGSLGEELKNPGYP